ncbi:hypothetical protein B0O80DRAFT_503311 [Mortierella sp. GBAus27b]|nr:hypothetical protein B0O80DRAFT_503311 [Mortierella sp. GBAus27b]
MDKGEYLQDAAVVTTTTTETQPSSQLRSRQVVNSHVHHQDLHETLSPRGISSSNRLHTVAMTRGEATTVAVAEGEGGGGEEEESSLVDEQEESTTTTTTITTTMTGYPLHKSQELALGESPSSETTVPAVVVPAAAADRDRHPGPALVEDHISTTTATIMATNTGIGAQDHHRPSLSDSGIACTLLEPSSTTTATRTTVTERTIIDGQGSQASGSVELDDLVSKGEVGSGSSGSSGSGSGSGSSGLHAASSSSTSTASTMTAIESSDSGAEFSCNICFDTSVSPVLTLCGHLFCWSCLHQWLEAQHQNPTCPVCKAGCAQDKVIPIYGRGKEQVDPRSSTTPKRPAGQRPEPLRNPNHVATGGPGFTFTTGQVTFSGTMIPPFMFSPFGIQYGATYTTAHMGPNGAVQTPMQAYVSRMLFMLGTLVLVGILLY